MVASTSSVSTSSRKVHGTHRFLRQAMQTVAQSASPRTEVNYLNNERSLKSWLTTVDHKRIAIMFASTLALAFLAGGVLALLIRTELLTPTQLIMGPDTYNRMFTMHDDLMEFAFFVT